MSSKRFVADLKPDPHLRNIVMLAGCAAALIGLVLLIRLPIPVPIRLTLIAVWAVLSLRQLDRQARGGQRTKSIRLEPGETSIIDRRGRQVPVQIMSGSVVLPRLAWLRLKFRDGLKFCELLRGDATQNEQWRRLQILWRQGPRAFGGAREADTISTRKSGSHF
jgi:hypothetical protein